MACMEHACRNPKCGHVWFDNIADGICKKCGSSAAHFFDEEPDPPDYDDDNDNYDDEDI